MPLVFLWWMQANILAFSKLFRVVCAELKALAASWLLVMEECIQAILSDSWALWNINLNSSGT